MRIRNASRHAWPAIGLAAALLSLSAAGAEPTGEENAIADHYSGSFPIVLSIDGNWLVHADAQHRLHRVLLADPRNEKVIDSGFTIRGMSSSRSGQKVAFFSRPTIASASPTFPAPAKAAAKRYAGSSRMARRDRRRFAFSTGRNRKMR